MSTTGAAEDAAPEKGKPGECEVIERPNQLKSKVGNRAGFDNRAMKRAEKVIAEEKVKFIKRIDHQIVQIESTFEVMRDAGEFDCERLWLIVHDLRSEAGTFGYPMLTQIGGSLCDLLDRLEAPKPRDVKVIQTHIAAMRSVVSQRLEGNDDDIANEVAAVLRDLVDNKGR